MESMSAFNMKAFGNNKSLTPTLDSIANQSLFFTNCFSDGIHTMNGVFSIFTSLPSIPGKHMLNTTDTREYNGIATTLKNKNYHNLFFMTHDDQFDNMAGFLKSNGIQKIYSLKDYPDDKILSTLGISDDFLFEFSIPKINSASKQKKPFFATLLTTSNHNPIVIPENVGFKPKSKTKEEQIIEYADWSIAKFFKMAQGQEWFNNTIFVFVADHGAIVGNNAYEMPLSYYHIPFFIYSPNYIIPEKSTKFCGQIDVFPTLMYLLSVQYQNKTLGMDLITESRPYAYFSEREKTACIDSSFFYFKTASSEYLYHYRQNNPNNLAKQFPNRIDSMKTFVNSMIQTSQYLIKSR
jgi:phosphoglycerol transferase MdoB-like AlkP superfamily enzyme